MDYDIARAGSVCKLELQKCEEDCHAAHARTRRARPMGVPPSRLLCLLLLVLCQLARPQPAHATISFLPPVNTSKAGAAAAEAADYDGDGKIDLYVVGDGGPSVFYGNGDGTFGARLDFPNPDHLVGGSAADVNGDGLLDLIIPYAKQGKIDVLINRGGRTYAPPVSYTVGARPGGPTFNDFNGDGKLDLALSNHESNNFCVLLNRGDGTFHPPVFYRGGSYPGAIVSADLNGDGKIDLAQANIVAGNVSIYLGDGTGAFSGAGTYPAGMYCNGTLADDLNGDGKIDLVTANWFGDSVSILYGEGDGTFRPAVVYAAGTHPGALYSADFDGDGDPDLVWGNGDTNHFSLLENLGDGQFASVRTFTADGGDRRSMAVGDFNGDGLPDVALGGRGDLPVGQEPDSLINVFLNNSPRPGTAIRGFTLDRESAVGGFDTVSGTITLTAPAPAGGIVVSLSGNLPALVLPAGVTVPEGAASVVFRASMLPVSAIQTGTVLAACDGSGKRVSFQVRPIGITRITVTPGEVVGGYPATGEVAIDHPAPTGGLIVALSSSQASVLPPPTVTVPAGATGVAFTVNTGPVTTATRVTVTAVYGGMSQTATLTVLPDLPNAAPSQLTATVEPPTWIRLSWADHSVNEIAFEIERKTGSEPFRRIASAGANAVSYTDRDLAPGTVYTYRVRAVHGSAASDYSNEASGSTLRIALAAVILTPESVTGGASCTGVVTLGFPAPPGGASVSLTNPNREVLFFPERVTVPAGATSASFIVATQPVAAVTRFSFTAFYGGESRTAALTLMPPVVVAAVTVHPQTVTGGRSGTGTVTLSAPAPAGGIVVSLSSDNPGTVTAPADVSVAAGTTVATFPLATHAVTSETDVAIWAGFAGSRLSALLKVTPPSEPPPAPTNLRVDEATPTRITLSWVDNSSTETGFEIERRTENSDFQRVWVVSPDVTVFRDAGVEPNMLYFYRVRAVNPAGASDCSNEASGSTLPAAVTFVTVSPDIVTGGQPSLGMVTLNGPAPQGGATLTLSSSSPAVAVVPESVTVPAGATWTTFPIATTAVTAATPVTLSAVYAGAAHTATLKLLPSGALGTSRGTIAETTRIEHIAVFRPTTRQWFLRAEDGAVSTIPFGGPGDVPVPADYLGAGRPQIAVFRPSTREWFIRTEDGKTLKAAWGGPEDIPVPGDYLQLHRAQIAVFRPSTRQWIIRKDNGTPVTASFGGPGDLPVPGDYFGLKRTQIAVFRPSTREWFIRKDDGSAAKAAWGGPGDVPVPGDYLRLGRLQIAVYRPSTSEFFLRDDLGRSTRIQFGTPGDVPVPSDYSAVGRTQIGVYRVRTGEWFVRQDDGQTKRIPWGGPQDRPVPGAYSTQ